MNAYGMTEIIGSQPPHIVQALRRLGNENDLIFRLVLYVQAGEGVQQMSDNQSAIFISPPSSAVHMVCFLGGMFKKTF